MTSIRFLGFLLFLLFHQVYSETVYSEAEPVFRAEGRSIEMGYCFAVDYIAVYRAAPEGDQLLGNSSADSTPPADLQGRIRINKHQHLPGLQISHLTHMDSGIYRRECWKNQTLVSQHTQQLFVCDKEVESEEIIVKEDNGVVELLCNSTFIDQEGTSVRWYHEKYPFYKPTLFLDSNVSLDPLPDEGVIEVRHSGALLLLVNSVLKNHFYCLVIKGKNCLSFQNMYLPDRSESRDIFASQGDRVVLNCSSDGNQQWETPLGSINASSLANNHMYISFGDRSEDFSLVIPAVSDEYSGEYLCISPSFEMQYNLVLCPEKKSRDAVFKGRKVFLDCDVGEYNFQGVQWHHLKSSGEYELIHDSINGPVHIPEDLMGRLTLSENGSSLVISPVEMKDLGVYMCVVLRVPEFLKEDDYEDDYDVEYTGEDEHSDDQFWHDTYKCIHKQEIILSSTEQGVKTRRGETNPTAEPPAASNVTAYAVGAGLVGLLVVGAIVAVIVIIRRKREEVSHPGLNMTVY